MRSVLLFLPALACVGAMYACMRIMGRDHGPARTEDATHDVAELKAEVARLRTELNEATRKERVDGLSSRSGGRP